MLTYSRMIVLLLCSLSFACQAATRKVQDATLTIETLNGRELGVSTEYGNVFLGRTARSGEVEISAYFGDGPSIESSVIEPLGGGLYTLETEIRLPSVPLTFEKPKPGSTVWVKGRRGNDNWLDQVTVRRDARVDGILISTPGALRNREDQIGAGVYVGPNEFDLSLVGLVSGRVRLQSADGSSRELLTVMGPDDLWRLVVHDRSIQRKRKFVYRDDLL